MCPFASSEEVFHTNDSLISASSHVAVMWTHHDPTLKKAHHFVALRRNMAGLQGPLPDEPINLMVCSLHLEFMTVHSKLSWIPHGLQLLKNYHNHRSKLTCLWSEPKRFEILIRNLA